LSKGEHNLRGRKQHKVEKTISEVEKQLPEKEKTTSEVENNQGEV